MQTEDYKFNDRLIRLPELERIFGVCKRTVRRKAEAGELPPLVRSGGVVGMLESKVKEYFRRLARIGSAKSCHNSRSADIIWQMPESDDITLLLISQRHRLLFSRRRRIAPAAGYRGF